jgi:hypothetical protein
VTKVTTCRCCEVIRPQSREECRDGQAFLNSQKDPPSQLCELRRLDFLSGAGIATFIRERDQDLALCAECRKTFDTILHMFRKIVE